MSADVVLIVALATPVALLGLAIGIHSATGLLGMGAFVVMAGLWGLAFTGFPYSIALRTGNPTAVNNAFLLFFPFAFLTTAYLPREHDGLAGNGDAASTRPRTCWRACARLLQEGWRWAPIGRALLAIAGVGAVSFSLAFAALRGRVKRN